MLDENVEVLSHVVFAVKVHLEGSNSEIKQKNRVSSYVMDELRLKPTMVAFTL